MATQRRLIKISEVQSKVAKNRSWIYAQIQAGAFPKQVSLGRGSVAWVESEIDAWIDARIEERDSTMSAA